MTQPLHSKSPVSRRTPSHQRQPPNFQPTDDNDDDDADDLHRHPPWRHGSQGSQPYPPGGAPRHQSSGSQASLWRPPEPSGISRTFAHANGQVYNTGPVQFPRRGSVNSTGSTSSGAGLHRAGFINSDQYRSTSVAPHDGSERPSKQSRGISWGSPNSRSSLGDFSVHRRHNSKGEQRLPPVDEDLSDASDGVVGPLDDRQSVRSTTSEQPTAWWETEAQRKEEEANRKEEEASRKEEEGRRLEEKIEESLEEARRLRACARQADASAKVREAAAHSKEARAKHKEAEAKKREAAAQKREAEVQRKEEGARYREREARRKEDYARKREDDARRREEEARRFEEEVRKKEEAKRTEEEYERKKCEIERKVVELKKTEANLLLKLKENAARLAQEEAARQALESSRQQKAEPARTGASRPRSLPQTREANRLREDSELWRAVEEERLLRVFEEQRRKVDEKNR